MLTIYVTYPNGRRIAYSEAQLLALIEARQTC